MLGRCGVGVEVGRDQASSGFDRRPQAYTGWSQATHSEIGLRTHQIHMVATLVAHKQRHAQWSHGSHPLDQDRLDQNPLDQNPLDQNPVDQNPLDQDQSGRSGGPP